MKKLPYGQRYLDKKVSAWAITHANGHMHSNWILGRGKEAWPGMAWFCLFDTRQGARAALAHLRANVPDGYYGCLPFSPRVVKVTIAEVA